MDSMRKQEIMQAIIYRGVGGTDIIETASRPVPVPAADEILIKVAATGMNRADILQRMGKHPPPKGVTDIPGLEVAGIDVATGEPVCALLAGGGYAAYAVAKREECFRIDDRLSMMAAAGLPEALFTVTKNVFFLGGLKAGEHLLIHGGASGIGTLAIQMAVAAGARVSVTAGSDARCALCRNLGATRAINYKAARYEDALQHDPVDVVLDMVGGDYVARDMGVLAQGGRHVNIAFLAGAAAQIDVAHMMRKQITLTGSMLRHDSTANKTRYADMVRTVFWPLVLDGNIKPVIDRTFPLSDARAAQEYFATGQHAGKIILTAGN